LSFKTLVAALRSAEQHALSDLDALTEGGGGLGASASTAASDATGTALGSGSTLALALEAGAVEAGALSCGVASDSCLQHPTATRVTIKDAIALLTNCTATFSGMR
jgi:hypothetical protein